MPANYSFSETGTYVSSETTQRVEFAKDNSPIYSYVTTTTTGSGTVKVRSRYCSGSSGTNWRDTEPHLRPVRDFSDEQREDFPGVLKTVVIATGYGNVSFNESTTFNIGGMLNNATYQSDAYLVDQTSAKFFAKLRDLKASMPVMAMEAGKTALMVKTAATRIYLSMKALKRGNFAELTALLGCKRDRRREKYHSRLLKHVRAQARREKRPVAFTDVSNLWLEYQYGWRPLITDVFGSVELLAEHHLDNDYTKWKSLRVSDRRERNVSTSQSYYIQRVNAVHTVKFGAYFRYKTSVPGIASKAGLTNPAEVAWELLPFSFVADWFVNIGDWLTAITALKDCEVVGGWYSSLIEQKSTTAIAVPVSRSSGRVTTRSFEIPPKYTQRLYRRTRWTPSVPSIRLQPDPFGTKRTISAIALVSQQIRRL